MQDNSDKPQVMPEDDNWWKPLLAQNQQVLMNVRDRALDNIDALTERDEKLIDLQRRTANTLQKVKNPKLRRRLEGIYTDLCRRRETIRKAYRLSQITHDGLPFAPVAKHVMNGDDVADASADNNTEEADNKQANQAPVQSM